MISISNLGRSFGDRTLFSGVSLQLNRGERYGLVGANGSGKTTFLNILSGDLDATEGHAAIPKDARLGVLRQDHFKQEDQRIVDVAMMGNLTLWHALEEREKILARAEEDFDAHRFAEVEEIVEHNDGYTAEARAGAILEGLGVPAEVHRHPLSTLSGGFKLRVLLAQVLASQPDVLLLDEPTNHLDILSIRWLELFLKDFPGPVVVISHDHRFLDNVATTILDVDYDTVLPYPGNYSDFLEAKEAEHIRREKDLEAREREISHHQKFVDRFRAKASKARQAQSKVRMIEKKAAEITEVPVSSRRYPTFRFDQKRPSGRDVLKIRGIQKSFGDNRVLHGVDLTVQRGDRLAIMGPNGIGKSTLLKIAMGIMEPDEGEVEWGYETYPGYFAQDHQEQFDDPTRTAESWIWDFCPDKDIGWVRGRLALMLFSGDEPKKRLETLSGGEAARLIFSRLGMENPNVLVLDEPTNHLDLESIEALVEGLKSYEGTLIFVSHDRWFVGALASRIVEIKPDSIRDYPGTYEEYVHFCGDDHLDADQVILRAKREKKEKGRGATKEGEIGRPSVNNPGGGLQGARAADVATPSKDGSGIPGRQTGPKPRKPNKWKLQQRHKELLEDIEASEARLGELDARFAEPALYQEVEPEKLRAMEEERIRLQTRLDELVEEWGQVEEDLAFLELPAHDR
jgi:ATPase subunit of ABC transporter with duplicated ATPase domains